MTKTLNQIIIFFLHQNQNIFSATLGIRIFFQKKPIAPPPRKLNGPSLIKCIAISDGQIDKQTTSTVSFLRIFGSKDLQFKRENPYYINSNYITDVSPLICFLNDFYDNI